MEQLLNPQKEALTKDEKKVSHENRKWAFVDGKGAPHQILIGAFIGGERGHL